MSRIVYYVVPHDREWKIRRGDNHYGPYNSKREAIDHAVDAAREAGQAHRDGSRVMVQVEDNRFRTEWTYSDARHPPPG